ncbi:ATP-grasp domain-containing protein [Flagellimonas nanhaiensis]|uniref:ATP-grasp domain-containing protein n=2 Tax=Flagellimonas nanhaiensis TaxID=2292706 RepID=A0A371JVZ3_9FLAO|nr:ATP-grasp domain-containing protein [Allomuricauda nanhaiensis]
MLIFVVNSLSNIPQLKIYVMSEKPDIAMRYSRHVHNYSYYPLELEPRKWIENINQEVERHSIDIILPVFETGIRKLIEYKDLLDFPEKLISWVDLKNYDIAVDKWRLALHMEKNGIPYPKTKLICFENVNDKMDYPFIVKPVTDTGGGRGVELIANYTDWEFFISKNAQDEVKYLSQEFIMGSDYCCNVLCKEGKILYYTIQRGILWGRNRFSAQTGYIFQDKQEILGLTEDLMKSLNWSGVACVDIRYDNSDDTFKVLEINARYWRSLMGSLSAGINFPYLSIAQHLNQNVEVGEFKTIKYLNLKGLVSSVVENPFMIFKMGFIWNNTPLKYALKDPLPMIYKFFWRNKNLLLKRFGRI